MQEQPVPGQKAVLYTRHLPANTQYLATAARRIHNFMLVQSAV